MKKLFIGISILIVILIGIYFFSWQTSKNVTIQPPIDNEQEAIAFAKHDKDVQQFISRLKEENLKVNTRARYYPDDNNWVVVIDTKDANDLWYEIRFKQDGTILRKGPGVL